jgi:hypothetical protein
VPETSNPLISDNFEQSWSAAQRFGAALKGVETAHPADPGQFRASWSAARSSGAGFKGVETAHPADPGEFRASLVRGAKFRSRFDSASKPRIGRYTAT